MPTTAIMIMMMIIIVIMMTKSTMMMGKTPRPSAPYHPYHQLSSNNNVQLQLFATQLTAPVVRPHSRTNTAVILLVLLPLLLPPLLLDLVGPMSLSLRVCRC